MYSVAALIVLCCVCVCVYVCCMCVVCSAAYATFQLPLPLLLRLSASSGTVSAFGGERLAVSVCEGGCLCPFGAALEAAAAPTPPQMSGLNSVKARRGGSASSRPQRARAAGAADGSAVPPDVATDTAVVGGAQTAGGSTPRRTVPFPSDTPRSAGSFYASNFRCLSHGFSPYPYLGMRFTRMCLNDGRRLTVVCPPCGHRAPPGRHGAPARDPHAAEKALLDDLMGPSVPKASRPPPSSSGAASAAGGADPGLLTAMAARLAKLEAAQRMYR